MSELYGDASQYSDIQTTIIRDERGLVKARKTEWTDTAKRYAMVSRALVEQANLSEPGSNGQILNLDGLRVKIVGLDAMGDVYIVERIANASNNYVGCSYMELSIK